MNPATRPVVHRASQVEHLSRADGRTPPAWLDIRVTPGVTADGQKGASMTAIL